jgi:hypothetical protein
MRKAPSRDIATVWRRRFGKNIFLFAAEMIADHVKTTSGHFVLLRPISTIW